VTSERKKDGELAIALQVSSIVIAVLAVAQSVAQGLPGKVHCPGFLSSCTFFVFVFIFNLLFQEPT
jgi:hypothetical protein